MAKTTRKQGKSDVQFFKRLKSFNAKKLSLSMKRFLIFHYAINPDAPAETKVEKEARKLAELAGRRVARLYKFKK